MAKALASFAKMAVAFLFLSALMLSMNGKLGVVEAKVCERRSKTWSGWCGNTSHCDRQCKNWEGAKHGACHAQFPGRACFCYFNC
ncbi:Defensin-like protein 19, partial [Cucurbita argyrosperma subsp. argyrosperma]